MCNEDNIIKQIDKISKFFLNGFNQDGYFQINGLTQYVEITQYDFSDSTFSFDCNNQRILHFTNLNSVIAIFKSKYLRLSNLNRFNDKLELLHSLRIVGEKGEKWNNIKNYIFVASFTPKRIKNISEYQYHWENYASNSMGCALEFEVIRKPLYPFHFSLKVNYLESSEELELMKYLNSNSLDEVVLESLIPILASIKEKSYSKEDEVRILFKSDELQCKADYHNENLEFCLSENNQISFFSRLPFIYANETNESDALLKLSAIYFGKNSEMNDGQEILSEYLIPQLKEYNIKFEWEN